MTDSAYASSQLYHAAFRNTMNKAMLFIDRQRKEWNTVATKEQVHHGTVLSRSTQSTWSSTPSLLTNSTQPGDENDQDEDNQDEDDEDDDNNSIRAPPLRVLSPPPAYLTLSTTSDAQSSLLPSHYLALLTTEAKKPLHLQRHSIKRRPLSMPPPPHYPDDTNDCRSSLILPREEEGKEDLPAYHCSVYKMATMEIKMERGPGRRSWRQVYLELWGTVLRIYPFTWFWSSVAKEPTYILSLAGAEAARALDYRKRPFVFRLTSGNGIKLLIQSANLEEMVSWIEHLQSGINISLDLEERPMPKFLTMPPRRGPPDTGILGQRMIEVERRREQRRLNQQEILA